MEEIRVLRNKNLQKKKKTWKNVDTGSTSDKAGDFLHALYEELQSAVSTATS